MKELAKLLTLLLACSAMLCLSSCGGDDEDAYEIVGLWKGTYNPGYYGSSPLECTLEVRKDCTYSYIIEYSTGPSSGSDTWRYEPSKHTWFLNGYLSGTYELIGGKLMCEKSVFTRSGDSGNNTEKYAGKDFVGTWQGSEGSNEFVIQLDADGTYTDWLVQNGQKNFKETGEYTVADNTLTVPGECNLANAWLNKPFTMSFSGKNQMTLTNKLMSDYKTKLVLNRK